MTWATKETNSEPNPDLTFATKPKADTAKSTDLAGLATAYYDASAMAEIVDWSAPSPKVAHPKTYTDYCSMTSYAFGPSLSDLEARIEKLRAEVHAVLELCCRACRGYTIGRSTMPDIGKISMPKLEYPTYMTGGAEWKPPF